MTSLRAPGALLVALTLQGCSLVSAPDALPVELEYQLIDSFVPVEAAGREGSIVVTGGLGAGQSAFTIEANARLDGSVIRLEVSGRQTGIGLTVLTAYGYTATISDLEPGIYAVDLLSRADAWEERHYLEKIEVQ